MFMLKSITLGDTRNSRQVNVHFGKGTSRIALQSCTLSDMHIPVRKLLQCIGSIPKVG